jgi:hypothetical protein
MRNFISSRSLRTVVTATVVALAASITVVAIDSAAAADCTPIKSTGKAVGAITIGSLTMPIKSFNYPAGGIMEPEKNTTAAGLSARHMPLSSKVGSSVIVWHRDYKGCIHALNTFMSKSAGTKFSITDEKGVTTKYRLNLVKVISKGDYQESWFNLIGPRQIVMFTCTGVFKSGHYEKNMVFIATPL